MGKAQVFDTGKNNSSGAAFTILAMLAIPAFAVSPVKPNCLGSDVSTFAQNPPFGQFIKSLSSGGLDNEFLAHLQGIPTISSCPDSGFPTPLH